MLPGERSFIVDDGLSVDRLGSTLRGDGWNTTIEEFERDGFTDPDARQLQELYGAWLRGSLAQERLPLSSFACGLSLCAGTVVLSSGESRNAYAAWRAAMQQDSTLPMPVFMDSVFTGPSGRVEGRFMFSTDPLVAGAVQRSGR